MPKQAPPTEEFIVMSLYPQQATRGPTTTSSGEPSKLFDQIAQGWGGPHLQQYLQQYASICKPVEDTSLKCICVLVQARLDTE